METKANYAIVGFFTVLVIAAAFGFVYWMANYGRGGEMAPLLVRIPGSANGLSVGSPVRFNGIQVGTVRTLTIDRQNPNFVVAGTDVRTDAPVYDTTRAVLEIQGLTGSAYIELTGGKVDGDNILAKALETGQPATLEADPSSVTNILATADQILQRANKIVDQLDGFVSDARGPLTDTIRNADTFSKALAENSDGINKFLESVAGLSKTITSVSGRLDSTLASAETLMKSVDPKKIDSIVSNVDEVTKQLAQSSSQIGETLAAFKDTARTYESFGADAKKTLDRVDGLLAEVDRAKVGQTVDNIAAASATARQSLDNLNKLTASFGARSGDIDRTIVNVSEMAQKLNAASTRVDAVLAKVDGFLGDNNSSDLMADAKKTLDSYRQLAETLNAKIGPIADNLQRFSGSGLNDVNALVNETRRSISRIERSISSIEDNPQRIIFGGEEVKQYDGRTRR